MESQKSTVTWRPASPPLALTMLAQALTAFTDFWTSPGASDVSTSAIMPILMVVAVSPMSVPGAAEVAADADVLPAAAVDGAAELEAVAPAADPVDELLELQPAASMTAASAAVTPSRRARAGNERLARWPAPPGLSLLAVTLVSLRDVIAVELARERSLIAPRRGLVTVLYVPVDTRSGPGGLAVPKRHRRLA